MDGSKKGSGRDQLDPELAPDDAVLPAASVIIPLKGGEPANRASIECMLDQDYGTLEVVVGIAEGDEMAASLVRSIQTERPDAPLNLVQSPNRLGGPRPKVSNLYNASEAAKYSFLALIDADILAGKDFLRSLLTPLNKPETGLTTSLYRAGEGGGLWSRIDGLWTSTAYLPGAIFGRRVIGEGFAFGAAIGIRRDVLDQIGGFAAISRQVGDDYQLGRLASSRGFRVELVRYVVTEQVEQISFRQFVGRRTRWARTIRIHQPAGYAGSFLMYSVPLALCGVLIDRPARWRWLGAVMANRLVCASLTRRRLDPDAPAWELLLTPMRDLLAFALWGLGFTTEKPRLRGAAP